MNSTGPIDLNLNVNGSPAKADVALLFYGESGMASVHQIMDSIAGAPHLVAGKLLDGTDLSDLARLFMGAAPNCGAHQILPERVLGAGPDFLTWYAPAAKRKMHFLVAGKQDSPDVIWPGLIFHAYKQTLFLVAYAGKDRPEASSPVFYAPLMNANDDTTLCRGSAVYPTYHRPGSIAAWEQAVFGTAFTHTNGSGKLSGRLSDNNSHLSFWKHRSRRRYPVTARHLVPLPFATSLEQWLEAIHKTDCYDDN